MSRPLRNSKQVLVMSAADAVALIDDDSVVTVSSSSALGCPDAVLKALGERHAHTGSPRNITSIHPIAAGDMYGVRGIDHIAHPELLTRVIAGSYPSGPSSSEPPLIWQRIAADGIEAWNLPSGVIYQQHRAGAAGQPGVMTTVGLQTFIDPRREGGALTASTPRTYVRNVEFDGREYLFYPAITPDVAIIRATTADEHGNLTYEHEGSPLGALDQAYAAHNSGGLVIAQVKRIVKSGTIPPQQVRVPGILVDVVVLAPDQQQTTQTAYDPAISGEVFAPDDVIEPLDWGLEKIIARRAAMELKPGWIVNLGFGISAGVPRVLAEEGLADEVTWVIEQGAVASVGHIFGCAQAAACNAHSLQCDRAMLAQRLAGRPDLHVVDAAQGALGGRVKEAQALHFVAKEVDAHRLGQVWGPEIDNTPASGKEAGFLHHIRRRVPGLYPLQGGLIKAQLLPHLEGAQGQTKLARRQRLLHERTCAGDDQRRGLCARLQGCECGQAALARGAAPADALKGERVRVGKVEDGGAALVHRGEPVSQLLGILLRHLVARRHQQQGAWVRLLERRHDQRARRCQQRLGRDPGARLARVCRGGCQQFGKGRVTMEEGDQSTQQHGSILVAAKSATPAPGAEEIGRGQKLRGPHRNDYAQERLRFSLPQPDDKRGVHSPGILQWRKGKAGAAV